MITALMNLSTREKRLLLLMVVVLSATVIFFGLQQVVDYQASVERRITQRTRQLDQAITLAAQLQLLSRTKARTTRRRSLIGHLEQLSSRVALRDRIQLNPQATSSSSNFEAVDIRLDDLTLDELIRFTFVVEDSRPALVVDRLDVSPAFRSNKLLRVTMRVLAEKK